METKSELPPLRRSVWRMLLRVASILVIAYGVHLLMDWVSMESDEILSHPGMLGTFITLLVAYAILISIPFLPGIEIGITLLVLQGASVAPFVWAATVLGLLIAYSVGHWVPQSWIHSILADLRLKRACRFLEEIGPLSREERLALLKSNVPGWLRPFAGKGRYFLLAILINMPGSAVIGGGGGIAFAAGLSKLYPPVTTLCVIALCVAPVPLAVWLWGNGFLMGA